MKRKDGVLRSLLWAAWADALGFITELAEKSTVRWRTGAEKVIEPVPWRRRIGGEFGAIVRLPAGTYSDDTQLRLATSRSIRSDGSFDVQAFAKIELPVFLNYGLGAGRGTKAAAEGLARGSTVWCTNFYAAKNAQYVDGGGNGAAMRIQPHVWSSSTLDWSSWMSGVVRNTVTSHGHPRALAGAVFHASMLAAALKTGTPPGPDRWQEGIDHVGLVDNVIQADDELSTLWLPAWERATGKSFGSELSRVVDECRELANTAKKHLDETSGWQTLIGSLGGMEPASRGSGTITAVAASALAWLARDDPATTVANAANTLGSDTDTVATMAGALLGAAGAELPTGAIQDEEFLRKEAHRLSGIADKQAKTSFQYPDLLTWSLPRAVLDYVGAVDNDLALAGLGRLELLEEPFRGRGRSDGVWQWARLPFGQHVLVRRRQKPRVLRSQMVGTPQTTNGAIQDPLFSAEKSALEGRPDRQTRTRQRERRPATRDLRSQSLPIEDMDLDTAVDYVIGSGFPEELIGRVLVGLANGPKGRERAIAFATAIAQAVQDRSGR